MEKQLSECLVRRASAAAELNAKQPDVPADRVTDSLVDGLNMLQGLLFKRIHEDVEEQLGHDSMLLPVSFDQAEQAAKLEIEAYQVAVAGLTTVSRQYINADLEWFVRWLGRLRLRDAFGDDRYRRRIRRYVKANDDERRLTFSRNLERVFPEATRAPLILYRLFPLAVQIVAAVAFGESLQAAELRNRQTFWLPEIGDCHECHGRPLENGDQCQACGNPLWTYSWLSADQ